MCRCYKRYFRFFNEEFNEIIENPNYHKIGKD